MELCRLASRGVGGGEVSRGVVAMRKGGDAYRGGQLRHHRQTAALQYQHQQ
jgi:hypothetical protein